MNDYFKLARTLDDGRIIVTTTLGVNFALTPEQWRLLIEEVEALLSKEHSQEPR